MTQANEPNDRNRSLDRQLRAFDRRIRRLEETQLTSAEFGDAFDRVYDEIDALEDKMGQRFDRLDREVGGMRSEMRELNNKFDLVMRHITGQN
jgi:uncharacterized coiled-coil DUF342 family protein